MRTIKFRGKASHNGEWLYGDLINIHGEYHILGEDDMRQDGHHVTQDSDRPTWVEPDTVGQFTGLFDKYGKEIYEGDILAYKGIKQTYYYKVWWNPKRYTFYIENSPIDAYGIKDECQLELSGNIHDNPELLTKKTY